MRHLGCGRHAAGRGLRVHVFIALVVLEIWTPLGSAQGPEGQNLPPYEVVHPTRVDARGHFLSHFLSHHVGRVQRRDASERMASFHRIFYRLWHEERSLTFNLTLNTHLLAPGFLTERRYGGLDGAQLRPAGSSHCHFMGEVWDDAKAKGSAAISACDGLTGLFNLSDEEFFLQPLEKWRDEASAPQAHAIYKRQASRSSWRPRLQHVQQEPALNTTCGTKNAQQRFEDIERQRERWEHRQQRRRRIQQRSVSKEKWVETLVVADSKMVEYHGSKGVENYVLAVMNIVAGLFRHASIGNSINIVVVRLVLLELDEEDLKITHHADNSLNSFCKWQKKLNWKSDEHPLHHDVSVLLTRKDICAAINSPCETLGLSHVAGMCQPHRCCSISEDTGLPLAFTVAHELGHNFGIQHDGNGNDCEPVGKRPFVMSPQLLYGTALPRWSRCSRQSITRFLDRGWGWCLDDPPAKEKLLLNSVLPGVLYSAAHQCRLQYGSASLLCDDMDNVCSTLWCTVGATCHSKLDGAVDGTSCGKDKWCVTGECVTVGHEPESVNGGWASWSAWSACSRTCGAGVQSAYRDCDDPVPQHRGTYCLGERRRYRLCNSTPCPQQLPTFRDVQCHHFNTKPYNGRFYKWEAVINTASPCELHCRPLDEHFSEKMQDAVTDGTPCYQGNKSRDMCINGICKVIGCDYVVESGAVEDRCGVCNGDGSTCTTVRRTFQETEGLGYVDIGLIPEGARDIRIQEVAEAGNFLALRSDNPNRYFLNGGWTIQWNGEYKAAGTVFTYERTGHLENLTSPGPTMEPLWIQLLFQETNPGVQYEYTISQNASEDHDPPSAFFWKHGSWTECSVTCGTGVQRQMVHCVERITGMVEEHLCDPVTRPDDNQTSCNKDPCPSIWWVGEWQKCSASCGTRGLMRRTVLCIQAVSVDEQKALQPGRCDHMSKPQSVSSCNTHTLCPADWSAGSWSECSLTCGSGVRRRNVTCSRDTGVDCDPQATPPAVTTCYIQDCPPVADNFGMDTSGSGWSSKEVLNEINSIPEIRPPPKHGSRSQPRNLQQNQQNHVERDFHFHNNIENTDHASENSQVDDFYYDYNFINFHENLLDDSESDGSDSGESLRSNGPPEAKPTEDMAPSAIFTTPKATAHTVNSHLDNMEDEGQALDLDRFLSEDYLLPVSTSRSTTQHRGEEAEPDGSTENITGMPTYQTITAAQPQDQQDHQYHSEGGTLNPGSEPVPEGVTKVQLDVCASETPQTSSPSFVLQEQTDFNTEYDLGTTSLPASEKPTQLPVHFLLISGNQEASDDSTPSTGAGIKPSTNLEGATASSATRNHEGTEAPFSERSGTETLKVTDPPPELHLESPAPPVRPAATWVSSTWSSCSTSCGLGAVWRTVACSSGSDSDCDPAKRPAPAQRCYLRPCSTWKVESWSKCSQNCDGGVMSREVQCFDLRDQRPLRPFHCRAVASRPKTHVTCNLQPCLSWNTAPWGQCSEVCGGGEQQRIVACPEDDRCDGNLQPISIQSCNSQPCTQWLAGSWGKCSASCGGGVQHRPVRCVDTKTDAEEEVDETHCDAELQPDGSQKCNRQECESAPSGPVCVRDRLSLRFCQTLRWLGRCLVSAVEVRCCRTCSDSRRPAP